MSTSPKQAIIVQQPTGCPHHANLSQPDVSVSVESIEQHKGTGWKLQGSGKIQVHCACPTCAMMFTAIRTVIPIECNSYSCPNCGETQNLEYKVQRIDADGSDFSFQAEILCPRCHKKRTFTQVLKELFRLKKIEVKLTGISIER